MPSNWRWRITWASGSPVSIPQIQDFNVLGARAAWTPALHTTFQSNSNDAPNQSFLAGAQGTKTSTDQFLSNVGITQTLPWGGNYDIGWDSSRLLSNNSFATFSPQLRIIAGAELHPTAAPQLEHRQRAPADAHQHQEPRDLGRAACARPSPRRRELSGMRIGTSPSPSRRSVCSSNRWISRRSRCATREPASKSARRHRSTSSRPRRKSRGGRKAVIVAEGQIATAEDTLRALVFDPGMPDFWTIRIEPTDLPPFEPIAVDADAAVRNALSRRTDLEQSRKAIEANDIKSGSTAIRRSRT